jgi:pyridoxal phosphate enzyme (YggS family)
LIAVSKTQPIEKIEALYRLGHLDFGENYVQEMVNKAEILEAMGCTGIRWHFLGHLQRNKVKSLVRFVHAVHSVDSEALGRELAKRWGEAGRPGRLKVFIQVNIDLEETKSGVVPEDAPALAEALARFPELELAGLMCIPNPDMNPSGQAFEELRELEEQCRPHTHGELSMGMSQDFEAAIREGATHIRVGTALFGVRQRPR